MVSIYGKGAILQVMPSTKAPPTPIWRPTTGVNDPMYHYGPMQVTAASLGDRSNPDSVLSICPLEMVDVITAALAKFDNWYTHPERIIRQRANVDDRDERLRLTFWDEYTSATAARRRMALSNVTTCLAHAGVYHNFYAKRLDKIAWMIYPPRNYSQSLKNILDKGLGKLQEIMELPILKPNGQPDVSVITQVIKVFQLVDARVKGAVVQRLHIEQKSLNVNVDGSPQQALPDMSSMSLAQLEALEAKLARIEEAEKRMVRALPPDERKQIEAMKAELGPPAIAPMPMRPEDDLMVEANLPENKT